MHAQAFSCTTTLRTRRTRLRGCGLRAASIDHAAVPGNSVATDAADRAGRRLVRESGRDPECMVNCKSTAVAHVRFGPHGPGFEFADYWIVVVMESETLRNLRLIIDDAIPPAARRALLTIVKQTGSQLLN
jgi:hypothetical protein